MTAISAGDSHSCAVVNGRAMCWGRNNFGQLGNNTLTDSPVPVQVSGLTSGVTAISAGNLHSCAVASGAAMCWGVNNSGQLGNGDGARTNRNAPGAGIRFDIGCNSDFSGKGA